MSLIDHTAITHTRLCHNFTVGHHAISHCICSQVVQVNDSIGVCLVSHCIFLSLSHSLQHL